MSTASKFPTDAIEPSVSTLQRLIATPIRTVAFWTAIGAPLAYPALLAGGLRGSELPLLGLALAVNVVALLVGHHHNLD